MINNIKLNHDYGAIKATGIVYNIKLKGFAMTTIHKISGFDKNLLEIHFKTPKFSFTGFYKANYEALGFPGRSEGSFLMNLCEF